MLKVLENLIIMAINLLIYYLIIKIYYTKLLLINRTIIRIIQFKILRKANYTYDDLTKPRKNTRLR